jgi:putative heme iron utilization protein
MSADATDWCTPEVVAAVAAHMNDDHADDCVVLCRAWGGHPTAVAARMTGMDPAGLDLMAEVDGAEVPVRVDFARPLTARSEVRAEVARLYHEAAQRDP